MADYRVYFLNENCRIGDAEEIEALSDDAAIIRAMKLLASRRTFRAFEIWEGCRAVRLISRIEAYRSRMRADQSHRRGA